MWRMTPGLRRLGGPTLHRVRLTGPPRALPLWRFGEVFQFLQSVVHPPFTSSAMCRGLCEGIAVAALLTKERLERIKYVLFHGILGDRTVVGDELETSESKPTHIEVTRNPPCIRFVLHRSDRIQDFPRLGRTHDTLTRAGNGDPRDFKVSPAIARALTTQT